jgi:hypothetical protein
MRPRPQFYDLSKIVIGARTDKPAPVARLRVAYSKPQYRGQCARCGGARKIAAAAGITLPCPECTGYQK